MNYVERFEALSFGLFVHFGLYSVIGRGEWYLKIHKADLAAYEAQIDVFNVKPDWAEQLVAVAKSAGCRYITLTTRHHDGFSLYDTCGLSDYDAPHSATGRDLIREFTDACRAGGIVPFFYHTLLDWHRPSYKEDFAAYVDDLIAGVEILCRNYGPIGGFWFDGKWDKPDADWQEDRLYATIRKYQPEAMIINNTGLSERGKVGHPEIDSVTFERGKPTFVDQSDKHRAGEMCQVLNDHWGYAAEDCNFKSVRSLIGDLIDCKKCGCNFLLNTGLCGDGSVNPMDACLLAEIGKWTSHNAACLYGTRPVPGCAEGADGTVMLTDGRDFYAIIRIVPMSSDPNVTFIDGIQQARIPVPVCGGEWLDDGSPVEIDENGMMAVPHFKYGTSLVCRVARLHPKDPK